MNILFVYPEFESFWGWKGLLKYVGKKSAFPPLGLLTVAAILRILRSSWEMNFVDMNVKRLTRRCLKWADYVFISARGDQEKSAKKVIRRCNKLGIPVVLGGAALETEACCEKFPGVSHFFLGKVNDTMPKFVADLEAGRVKRIYVPKTPPDIRTTPIPLWELADSQDYSSAIMECSMGCPYRCTFCNSFTTSGPWQGKSPDQVEAELEALHKAGYSGSLLFADENVTGKISHAKAVLERISSWQERRGHPFKITGQVPVTIADDDQLLELKVRAGVVRVFLGIETFNQAALRECRKFQNLGRDLVACVHKILSHGIDVASGFIVGFDSDTEQTFDEMVAGIQAAGIGIAMVDTLQAQPGTVLFEQLNAQNRISYDSFSNTDARCNFKTAMPLEDLKRGYRKILRRIWDPKGVYERTCVFLEKYNPSKQIERKLEPYDLKAFWKSVFWIGFLRFFWQPRVARYYWKSLRAARRVNKRAFPEVVARQMHAVHFRKFFAKTMRGSL